jgi:chromatin remodeling complex protein RSC6
MSTEVMTTLPTPTDTVVDTMTKSTSTIVPDVDIIVDPMVRQLSTMAELLETLAKTSKSLTLEMKALTKDVNKLRASKMGKKVKRVVDPENPRKPGALEKPVPISDELADFLGLTKGEMYSRQSVTQGINKYVKDNELQNPENRRYILLESEAGQKLKTLLRDPDQPLTFFNIQRYLKDHYPKTETTGTESKESEKKTSKAKSVDVSETPAPETTPATTTAVVPDAAQVEEGESSEPPKKKVVRKVVKKSPATA